MPLMVQRALLRWVFQFRADADSHSGSRYFSIGIGPESLSPSRRNRYRHPPGIVIAFVPESLSASSGICSPTLRKKRVTPHVLRHTAAMELLQAGVDRSVIALWLGHESIETTQIYLDADLALKEKALAKMTPLAEGKKTSRYKPDDTLLAFLKKL